jgi:hypothetical protein
LLGFFRRSVVPRGENDIVLRRLFALVALFLLTSVAMADAKTFRYAYRIDPASLDPHALAETFTLSWLGQVYEPLVGRGKPRNGNSRHPMSGASTCAAASNSRMASPSRPTTWSSR